MKSIKLLIVVLSLVAFSAFSASAQDEQKTKTEKDKKTETKTVKKNTDKTERQYLVGSRGGCYYLTASGKKSYVDKKFCEGITEAKSETKTTPSIENTEQKSNTKVEQKPVDTTPTDLEKADDKSKEMSPIVVENEKSETKTTDTVTPETKTTDPVIPAENKKKKTDSSGRTYIKGSRGGCYYLNESGKKVYVKDKSLCEEN